MILYFVYLVLTRVNAVVVKLVDKLIEECTEIFDEVNIAEMVLFEHENECVFSYITCVILAVIALAISIGIAAYFTYKYMNRWYFKKDAIRVKFVTRTQTTI